MQRLALLLMVFSTLNLPKTADCTYMLLHNSIQEQVKAVRTIEEKEPDPEIQIEDEFDPAADAYEIYASWNGPKLNRKIGTIVGPSGKETYYNLNMKNVVNKMRDMGFSSQEYDYWVRQDGCKMFGPYIMCAANLQMHPRGSFVPTSLGVAIVCDTGSFAEKNPYQLDIAVNW